MNKLLFLALWMWFPTALGSHVRCVSCEFERPGPGCILHGKPCTLHVGESCYKKSVFYGNTPVYIEKGCMQGCVAIDQPKTAFTISEEIQCCSDLNFCNRT